MKQRNVGIRDEDWDKLKEIKEKDNYVSVSDVVRRAIWEFMERRRQRGE